MRNCEFGGIYHGLHCQKCGTWKNEKDWPPIHSGEQSFQIILLNVREFLFYLFAEGLASFELNDL